MYLTRVHQREMPHSSCCMVKDLGDGSDNDVINNVNFEAVACHAEKLMEYASRA